jgi:small-conductance mechanosensitive channel
MTDLQERLPDVRRGCEARDERAFASPAPVRKPLFAAAVLVPSAALVGLVLGLSVAQIFVVIGSAVLLAGVIAHRTVRASSAGLALLLIRPYSRGERLRFYSPADDCTVEGEIVHIGVANTTLATADGPLVVANDRLLGSSPRLY